MESTQQVAEIVTKVQQLGVQMVMKDVRNRATRSTEGSSGDNRGELPAGSTPHADGV